MTCVNQEQFIAVVGKVEPAKQELVATGAPPAAAAAAAAPAGKKEAKKDKKEKKVCEYVVPSS